MRSIIQRCRWLSSAEYWQYGVKKKAKYDSTVHQLYELLDRYNIEIEGKHVEILGGVILLVCHFVAFLHRNATVTICHSKTRNMKASIKLLIY